ncbi:hypothetical protein ACFX2C_002429 [Malus domestica]
MLDPNTNTHEHPFLFNSSADDQIKGDTTTYDSWQAVNYASRAQKTAQNYANYRSWNSMDARINVETTPAAPFDESNSPPLWKTTNRVNNYRSLSPTSRTQAIARGQREMMEMVKNMPEPCYELSLKDLVEHKYRTMGGEEEDRDQEEEDDNRSTENLMIRRGNGNGSVNERKNNGERKKMVMRSGSIDSGGFLLKMVLPISLGGKKKNNKSIKKKGECLAVGANSNNLSAKVSPKPQGVDGSVKGVGVDNEWWKMKRVSVSERSESGVSSINSGSMKSSGSSSSSSSHSSRSNSRRKSSGCWSFIMFKKNKRKD